MLSALRLPPFLVSMVMNSSQQQQAYRGVALSNNNKQQVYRCCVKLTRPSNENLCLGFSSKILNIRTNIGHL